MIGLAVGILPGIGPTVCMVLAYPFLATVDPFLAILFYVNMVIASQFSGSVTSVVYGVPGENTSFVASTLGFKYTVRSHGQYALAITSLGSAIASILALAVVFLLFDTIKDQTFFYSSKTQTAILILVYLSLIMAGRDRWSGVLQLMLASGLALIGYNEIYTTSFTFGIDALISGLAWMPVVMAVMVIPGLYHELWKSQDRQRQGISINHGYKKILRRANRFKISILRSSSFGIMFGLIPGIGTVAVSSAAYFFEKIWTRQPSKLLLAAENSNNSAVVASLVPLLAFGIPINTSETLLIELLQTKNTIINMEWFLSPVTSSSEITKMTFLFLAMAATSILAMLFCWQWVKILIKTYVVDTKVLFALITVILMCAMVYQSLTSGRLMLDMITFLLLLPLGWAWRGKNVMTFMISFVIFDYSSKIFTNFLQTI